MRNRFDFFFSCNRTLRSKKTLDLKRLQVKGSCFFQLLSGSMWLTPSLKITYNCLRKSCLSSGVNKLQIGLVLDGVAQYHSTYKQFVSCVWLRMGAMDSREPLNYRHLLYITINRLKILVFYKVCTLRILDWT